MRLPWRLGSDRGSALLAVMWLSIALTLIAFTLARTVRTEFDRADLNVDSTRAYFLARGGIERAMMYLLNQRNQQEARPGPGIVPGQRWMRFSFPAGNVAVQIVAESGKLNVNNTPPEALARTLTAAGVQPALAGSMAGQIETARSASRGQILNTQENTGDASSFSRRPSSFQYLEELLVVPGITPELLYGTYRQDLGGNWMRVGGLHRHLSVLGSATVDVNYASPEVMRAADVPGPLIAAILEMREIAPIGRDFPGLEQIVNRAGPIRVTGARPSGAYTLWAEARLHTGRTRRMVGALVQRGQSRGAEPIRVVRWYDTQF